MPQILKVKYAPAFCLILPGKAREFVQQVVGLRFWRAENVPHAPRMPFSTDKALPCQTHRLVHNRNLIRVCWGKGRQDGQQDRLYLSFQQALRLKFHTSRVRGQGLKRAGCPSKAGPCGKAKEQQQRKHRFVKSKSRQSQKPSLQGLPGTGLECPLAQNHTPTLPPSFQGAGQSSCLLLNKPAFGCVCVCVPEEREWTGGGEALLVKIDLLNALKGLQFG